MEAVKGGRSKRETGSDRLPDRRTHRMQPCVVVSWRTDDVHLTLPPAKFGPGLKTTRRWVETAVDDDDTVCRGSTSEPARSRPKIVRNDRGNSDERVACRLHERMAVEAFFGRWGGGEFSVVECDGRVWTPEFVAEGGLDFLALRLLYCLFFSSHFFFSFILGGLLLSPFRSVARLWRRQNMMTN
jgi:hypothetical protein